jgi:hypothetical protein
MREDELAGWRRGSRACVRCVSVGVAEFDGAASSLWRARRESR